jgi:hypothetical protein
LSLKHPGLTYYGPYCIVLKETAIKDRATVFEENSINFVRRHKVTAGDPLPPGFRATWGNRSLLAVAKLGNRLKSTLTEDDFPKLLVSPEGADPDFIEVHIYGPFNRRAIQNVAGPEPVPKADRVIYRSILKKLKDIEATKENPS